MKNLNLVYDLIKFLAISDVFIKITKKILFLIYVINVNAVRFQL